MERKTNIRFVCSTGILDYKIGRNLLALAINEPKPCEYVITVFMPAMCHFDDLNKYDGEDVNFEEEEDEYEDVEEEEEEMYDVHNAKM